MFNFLKRRKIYKIPNTYTIAFGLPQVPEAIYYLENEEYSDLSRLYISLNNGDKTLLLDAVALNGDMIHHILTWLNEEPENWLSNLFAGVAYTYVAWNKRTGQYAKDLTDSQIEGFHRNLIKAYQTLTRASTLNSDEPETYSRLIRVNMGLSEKQKAIDCFDILTEIDAGHLGGHLFMANMLAAKWLGSEEEEKNFIEQFKNPKFNELNYVIYLKYVVDDFLTLSFQNEYTAERKFKKKYRKQIKEAYAAFDIPAISTYQRYYLHNYFSYIFYLIDEKKLRNQEIELIGNNISQLPWAYAEVEGEQDLKLVTLQ